MAEAHNVVGSSKVDFCGGTGGEGARSDAHELTASPGIVDQEATSMKRESKFAEAILIQFGEPSSFLRQKQNPTQAEA